MPPGGRLDRDVVLRFRERRQSAPARLLVRRDREGEGATFALTIDPEPAGGPAPPRDVVFVLDRSGSMEGWKMTTARRAAMAMIDALGERDRFALLAFDDTVESPHLGPNGLTLAPAAFRQRSEALAFLERLGARGGTEMGPPLLDGARLLQADASRQRAAAPSPMGLRRRTRPLRTPSRQRLRALRPRLRLPRSKHLWAFFKRFGASSGGARP